MLGGATVADVDAVPENAHRPAGVAVFDMHQAEKPAIPSVGGPEPVLLRNLDGVRLERLAQMTGRPFEIVLVQQRAPEVADADNFALVVAEQTVDIGACIRDAELARIDPKDHRRACRDQIFQEEFCLLRAGVFAPHLCFAEGAIDGGSKSRKPLFDHVISGTGLQPLDGDLFAQRARDEDERDVRRSLDSQRERGLTIEGGKTIVRQNHIEPAGVQGVRERVASVDHHDVARQALRAQRLGDQFAIDWIVLDVQHAQRFPTISHGSVPPCAVAAAR